MWQRSILSLLLCLVALLVPLSAQAGQPLRIGTNIWPGYEPLYLAAEREGWREELGVRLVEYPSATEVIRAFRNRAIEAAALTLDEVLTLREAKIPLKVITVLDVSAGGDVIMARAEVGDFSGLSGRRVGVESSALGAYVLTRALELNGMALDQLEIVHLDVSAHERAFKSGEVDAVVTFDPVRTKLSNAGAQELFSSREIPREVVDVLVVHADLLRAERARLQEVVAGWFRALERMREDPLGAARFTARRLKMTPEEVIKSYQGLELPGPAENREMLGGGLDRTLERLQQTLIRERLLYRPVAIDDLLEDALIPR